MGIDRQSPLRARAALRYALQELTQQGHCGFPRTGVLERTATLTGIDVDVLAETAAELVQEGDLIEEAVVDSGSGRMNSNPDLRLTLTICPLTTVAVPAATLSGRGRRRPGPEAAVPRHASLARTSISMWPSAGPRRR